MIRFADYTCINCGHTESDIAVDTNKEEDVLCPMCSTKMNKMVGGPIIKTKSRTERPFPTHLLGGGERANFSR